MVRKAFIERFEGDQVVITIVSSKEVIVFPMRELPAGIKPGDWVKIHISAGKITDMVIDLHSKTAAQKRIAAELKALHAKKA